MDGFQLNLKSAVYMTSYLALVGLIGLNPIFYMKLNEKFINFVKSGSSCVGKRDYVAHIVIIIHMNIFI
jgi:hypothetical protein